MCDLKSFMDILAPDTSSSNTDNDPIFSSYEPETLNISPHMNLDEIISCLKSHPHSFSVFSLNCQSLNAKFNELLCMLQLLNTHNVSFCAITLQETWTSEFSDMNFWKIDGYNLIHKPVSSVSKHGGLLTYIRKDFHYTQLPSGVSTKWENLVANIDLKQSNKNIILNNLYRPPHYDKPSLDIFLDEFDSHLKDLNKHKAHVIISGDFNLDLLKYHEKPYVESYVDSLFSSGYIPQITLPTRYSVQYSSWSLIDNIHLRSQDLAPSDCFSAVFTSSMSDHFACIFGIDFPPIRKKHEKKIIKIQCQKDNNIDEFREFLHNSKIMDNLNTEEDSNPSDNYDKLDEIITVGRNTCLPTKIVKFSKHKHMMNPWMTEGILISIKFRDSLHLEMTRTSPDSYEHQKAKTNHHSYQKIIRRLIRCAKRMYYFSLFSSTKNDLKTTWKHINNLLNKNAKPEAYPDSFLIHGNIIKDEKIIADAFNNFFVSLGLNLASSIKSPLNSTIFDYLKQHTSSSFCFQTVDEDKVSKSIDSLEPKASCGFDGISSSLLKKIKVPLIEPLTLIINQCIVSAIFPDKLKHAKVIPIFKKGNREHLENYRPISLLPVISKILEHILHEQLFEYLSINKLLYDHQYGFRTNHSTEFAMMELHHSLLKLMDKTASDYPFSIFMDLSKAFDTLDHSILCNKLSYYGLDDSAVELFRSYLSNRKQLVLFNDTYSDFANISTGVPQGSVLGPLLFLIYINDLHFATSKFSVLSYADDTTLTSSYNIFSNEPDPILAINDELQKVSDWLKINKLSLNIGKTKIIRFRKNKDLKPLPIKIDNISIEHVTEFNFLGIIVDENLSWKPHFNKITLKISRTSGIISKLKHFLPIYILRNIYNSLALPYINYGILSWGLINTKRILTLQKKIVRNIYNTSYNAHSMPYFKKLKILEVDDLFLLNLLKLYYKIKIKTVPSFISSFAPQTNFDLQSQTSMSGRITRQSFKPYVNRTNKVFTSKCIPHSFTQLLNHAYRSQYPTNLQDSILYTGKNKCTTKPCEMIVECLDNLPKLSLKGYCSFIKYKFWLEYV